MIAAASSPILTRWRASATSGGIRGRPGALVAVLTWFEST
jgi:hypothetical protein